MNNLRSTVPTTEVLLERFTFDVRQELDAAIMGATCDVNIQLSAMAERMVASIRGYVWAATTENHFSVRYPADWREALKERFFPKWALKRFPVKYTDAKAKIKRYLTLPEFKPPIPPNVGRTVLKTVVLPVDEDDYNPINHE